MPASIAMTASPRLTLCMIVRDEAANLPACLDSVAGLADEIVVVDTGSIDATREIARSRGARVIEAAWTGDFAAARNLALGAATGAWILVLDADEALPPASRIRLRETISGAGSARSAYNLVQKNRLADGAPAVRVRSAQSVHGRAVAEEQRRLSREHLGHVQLHS